MRHALVVKVLEREQHLPEVRTSERWLERRWILGGEVDDRSAVAELDDHEAVRGQRGRDDAHAQRVAVRNVEHLDQRRDVRMLELAQDRDLGAWT